MYFDTVLWVIGNLTLTIFQLYIDGSVLLVGKSRVPENSHRFFV